MRLVARVSPGASPCYARRMVGSHVAGPLAVPPPIGPGLRPQLWQWRDLGVGVAVTVAGFAVLASALALTRNNEGVSAAVALAMLLFELTLVATVLVLAARRGIGLAELGFVAPERWRPLVFAWVGAYAILFLYTAAMMVLQALGFPVEGLLEGNAIPLDAALGPLVILVIGLAVVVAAPFGEELLFRALFFRGMRGYWRFMPAAWVSGLMFALFHVNLSVVVPFAFIGALFAWAYEESGSLWVTIAAHGGLNGVSFVVTLLLLE